MEDVLAVYRLPYDRRFPVICTDESSKQLIGEVHAPIARASGRGAIVDHEYVRNGTAQIFVEIEPLAGRRHVEVTETQTGKDWAEFIRAMLEECYPDAIRVRLVMDNLNTHDTASLYEAFEPEMARRLADRLEIHYTLKHGSWLNLAEIELSALCGQCLNRRIPHIQKMREQVRAWESDRNNRGAPVNWHFTNEKARIKLRRLYPNI
jgi:hypothetical protein